MATKQNPAEARAFLDSLIAQGNESAIMLKVEDLDGGRYGFEKNSKNVKAFIDDLVEKKNNYAMKIKVDGLVHGKYGYAKDPEAGYTLARKELITSLDGIGGMKLPKRTEVPIRE